MISVIDNKFRKKGIVDVKQARKESFFLLINIMNLKCTYQEIIREYYKIIFKHHVVLARIICLLKLPLFLCVISIESSFDAYNT